MTRMTWTSFRWCTLVVASLASLSSAAGAQTTRDTVLLGRAVVVRQGCGGCHNGEYPAAAGWLAGAVDGPAGQFQIGACAPQAKGPCFKTWARNITPDNATGIGRFTERQLFNALRFGLRPGETPDVTITSSTPGVGNFPASPRYLAPPMPWFSWRHMPDRELWAIAAYLKRGLKPVNHHVDDSEGPPDFWASVYGVKDIGAYPVESFPTAQEVEPK